MEEGPASLEFVVSVSSFMSLMVAVVSDHTVRSRTHLKKALIPNLVSEPSYHNLKNQRSNLK